MSTTTLVGRNHQRRVLGDAVDAAAAGAGGLVLVTGEAGIGKTSLVTAALADARAAGATVVTATCWAGEGAPGLWPWMQVVRSLRRVVDDDRWARAAADAGAGLDRLLRGGDAPGPAAGTFDVVDAVVTLVTALAQDRPTVVAIEDLHWADGASLALLDALVGPARLGALLLLGTFRDDEAPPALDAIAARATTVHLTGLDADACAAVLLAAGVTDPAADAGEAHRRSGGNPFFLQQLAQLWSTGSATGSIPPAVGAVVERRLARLPAPVAGALVAASVLGLRFDAELLAVVVEADPDDVAAHLETGRAAGLVAPEPDGTWRFVHDLVRESLLAATPVAARRRHHAAAARALLAAPARSRTHAATAVADHAARAVPEIPADEAVDLLCGAAADASGRLAADEAAGHLERALGLLAADDPRRDVITLQLAAEQQRGGHLDAGRATYGSLLDRTDPETFAAAALGIHRLGTDIHRHDDAGDPVATLLEARDRLLGASDITPARRDELLASTLSAIVRSRAHQTELDRSDLDSMSAEAVELARRSGDTATLAFALLARHDAIWDPSTVEARRALAIEMAAAARASSDRELELQAVELEFVARIEGGDPGAFRTVDRYVDLEGRVQLPRCRYRALSRLATVATLQGRFEDADRLIAETLAVGERVGEVDRRGVWCDQSWEVARQRGDLTRAAELVEGLGGDPHIAVLELCLHLDRGELDEVARLDQRFQEIGDVWPRWARAIWWVTETEIAAATGDLDRGRRVRALLGPLSGQWVVLGGGVLVRGPIDHWIAVADLALGDADAAVAGFESARAAAERLGARPWVVHARVGLARALRLRNGPGDAADAGSAAAAAMSEATELGMAGVLTALAGRSRRGTFVRDGDVWTLGLDDDLIRLTDAKGLRDLHTLIAGRGRDIGAVELLSPGGTSRRVGSDPVLDDRAKASYRRRLDELDDAIALALDRSDDARAAALDAERAALVAELRAATGLGGRDRRLGDDAERARKAVTGRIRDALRRIAERHPSLAAHLEATVTTGASCRYDPSAAESINWQT